MKIWTIIGNDVMHSTWQKRKIFKFFRAFSDATFVVKIYQSEIQCKLTIIKKSYLNPNDI